MTKLYIILHITSILYLFSYLFDYGDFLINDIYLIDYPQSDTLIKVLF
jgi:hypothetical protein